MFTTAEIAAAVGGRLIGGDVRVKGISTDTRTIEKGDLFVAVRGESFDGNDYIVQAAEKGAAAALCERAADCGIAQIIVEDSRAAQLMLSAYHRNNIAPKLVGITGSVGKTSTKDMVYAVLSSAFETLKTEGNFNNDIGLPKTLFRLNASHKAAVIEMGMSDLGEISVLSKAAQPDCCVITNIGYCHIENLKTRENILRAKLEILDGARADAPLILCGDDEYLGKVELSDRAVIRYGFGDNNAVRAEDITHLDNGEEFALIDGDKRYSAKVPVSGAHHILNALAAYCVGKQFGLNAEQIIPAFMDYQASGLRQRTEKRGGITLVLDCYNASPTSMESSLSVLGGMSAEGRKIAVLGDMLELGDMSAELHASVAEYVVKNAEVCFLFGAEMSHCANVLRARGFEVYHSTDKELITSQLIGYIRDGDVLLFKGSRGMRMEEIAEKIE